MPKINILDSSVYNRISAGEVVQQPASIVKELLENSIDAGADNITIEILDGGIKEICVIDNGIGISKSDIKNAFLPHATSKVKDVSDLDSISTLGFRGEALASIASVSLVEVISKTEDDELGVKLTIQGGEYGDMEECARNTGTTMRVQNIFYNTPARAKFLKKTYLEEADVTTVVQKTIFSNPNVAFTYVIDDKIVYKTDGEGLNSAIKSVYGYAVHQDLLPVEFEKNNVKINGYICAPSTTKPKRNYQTIIINGRFVSDFSISSVVANAFGERLMKRKFPIFVLDIVIPFDDVDVNVHPAKTEVRLKTPSAIYGFIYNAIKNALLDYDNRFSLLSSQVQEPEKDTVTIQNVTDNPLHDKKEFVSPEFKESEFVLQDEKHENTQDKNVNDFIIDKLLSNSSNKTSRFNESNNDSLLLNLLQKSAKEEEKTQTVTQTSFKNNYDYVLIGQLFDCYILLQSGDNFLIIDQHAAHEKLLYDELIAQSNKKEIVTQPMLLPYTATYNAKDFARIMDIADSLNELGIEIEEFGKYTIKISSLPLALVGMKLNDFLNGFLSDFDNRSDFSFSDLLKEKLAARACRSAIKAGDKLQKEQIDSIIKQILDSNTTLQCPHGRPIAIKYTKTEIEKLFKRIV